MVKLREGGSLFLLSLQFLLGIFYYIEAVVLLEDVIGSVSKVNQSQSYDFKDNFTYLEGVSYYSSENITLAYRNAA